MSKEDIPITWKRDLKKSVIKTSKFEPSKLNKLFFIEVNLKNHWTSFNILLFFVIKRGQISPLSQKGGTTQWLVAKEQGVRQLHIKKQKQQQTWVLVFSTE